MDFLRIVKIIDIENIILRLKYIHHFRYKVLVLILGKQNVLNNRMRAARQVLYQCYYTERVSAPRLIILMPPPQLLRQIYATANNQDILSQGP